MILSVVSNRLHYLDIRGLIVGLYTVFVVGYFTPSEFAAKFLFGYDSMLICISTHISKVVRCSNSDENISIRGDRSTTLP